MQRRAFVKSGALALVTLGLSPSFLRRTAFGAQLMNAPKGKTLICLFQRGAADALNIARVKATRYSALSGSSWTARRYCSTAMSQSPARAAR